MMFESSSKNRKSWDGRQMTRQCIPDTRNPEATDENDLEAAMVVLRVGTHIDKDEEERYCVYPHIFGTFLVGCM